MTETVVQIPTTDPAVRAFRIAGEVDSDAMAGMGETMNAAFDAHDSVRLLLIFDRYDGSTAGAAFSAEALKAQLRSLSKLEKYAVVGAPEGVAETIETAGDWTGVETGTFARDDEAAAWRFVGAEARNAA